DNLLSNAVAYTPQDGTIRITLTDHRLTMQNTVTKQIDTTELKRPFITGDAARSKQTGSGLGLSIADAAANAQGFRLTLQCSDNAFTAMLHY
ncbi:MAG: sensor histidine kinase, partial [Oscillospiraceae bacterium]|nr:sensor histidine kinase [Oscillospiraceae bacterium]